MPTSQELYNEDKKWRNAVISNLAISLQKALEPRIDNPTLHSMVQSSKNGYKITDANSFNLLVAGYTGMLHTRFRGQSTMNCLDINARKPCIPTISRKRTKYDTTTEFDEVDKFKSTSQGKEIVKVFGEDDPILWLLTQHYGNKSRLLDITRNHLIALYFACSKDTEYDGVVYIFINIEGNTRRYNTKYSTYQEHILDPKKNYLKDTPVHIRPNKVIDRLERQEGEFIMYNNYDTISNGTYDPYSNIQKIPIIIEGKYKEDIIKQLEGIYKISRESLML